MLSVGLHTQGVADAQVALTNFRLLDQEGPQVVANTFEFDARQTLSFTFYEDVISTDPAVLVVTNLTTGQTFAAADFAMQLNGRTGTFVYTGGILPDGNYRATLPAGSVETRSATH